MVLLGRGIMTYDINLPFMNASSARGYYVLFFGILLTQWMGRQKNNAPIIRLLSPAPYLSLF